MDFFNRNKNKLISYAKTAGMVVLFLLVAIPFGKKIFANDVTYTLEKRYVVVLNNQKLGYVSDKAVAEKALLAARNEINSQSDKLALVNSELEFYTEMTGGELATEDSLASSMVTVLKKDVTVADSNQTAFTVRIDDFTVTLASKEDVIELLERVKSKYSDATNEFTVELVKEENDVYTMYSTNLVSADVTINEAAKVLANQNGEGTASDSSSGAAPVYADGVISISFGENIEVIPTKYSEDNIMSVDEAYELITKEHQEKGKYTVVYGDCLSTIASKHGLSLKELLALNEGMTTSSKIYAGDELVITVPASELSVVVVEEKSYNESYAAPIKYVDNPNWYRGNEKVKSNGSSGTRSVIALVTYVNGVETGREIIHQEITKAAVAKVVERGTLTPPTFVKPVNCNIITQTFKPNHQAVDYGVRMNTPVKAAASGKVVYAGWFGTCGYTVKIQHANGMITQYSHLNSIVVKQGQKVNQLQLIAYSGATGRVTGPHLHFGMIKNGVYVSPYTYVGR